MAERLSMKVRNSINPNVAKFISSLLIALVVITIDMLLVNRVLEKARRQSEIQYRESCERIAEGYATAMKFCIEDYILSLDLLADDRILSGGTPQEIQRHLSEKTPSMPEFFLNVFFADLGGTAYINNGLTVDVSDRAYFDAIVNRGERIVNVDDPVISKTTGQMIIHVSRPVYGDGGNLKGLLSASIKLSTIQETINGIQIGRNGHAFMMNSSGIFIAHPDPAYLMRSYTPPAQPYRHLSSSALAKTKFGTYQSLNTDGEPVDVTVMPVENTTWVVGISLPISQIHEIYNAQQRYKTIALGITIAAIIILLVMETVMFNSFQKRQMLETIYDPLTNLWTRQKFEKEAKKLLKRNSKSKFMLVEADIRGFKFINQNFGEKEADKLIVHFAKMVEKYTAPYNGISGRGYADHFYALYPVKSVRMAMNTFKENLEKINEEVKQYDIQFFPKFGISFLMSRASDRETTVQGLIGQASFAKSTIKDNMLTQYSIYNSRLLQKINEEQYIESHMEKALENHEFFVMYQPKIQLSTDKIVGAEALVRWKDSKLGLMTPDKFIPLFERNGFIKKLDFYVYNEVFAFIQRQLSAGNRIVPISLNMSRNHSKPDRFIHDFVELFRKYSIPPELIEVEILERSVMNSTTLQEITDGLHREGFTVAMDDFGSGESSLNMLTTIPVDVLKFDRAFLLSSTAEDGSMDKSSEKFIEILVELSKHLHKQTIFEGVETQAQRDFLKSINCDQVQGYFYSKPLSEADFLQFMARHS